MNKKCKSIYSLLKIPGLHVEFIELCRKCEKYQWQSTKKEKTWTKQGVSNGQNIGSELPCKQISNITHSVNVNKSKNKTIKPSDTNESVETLNMSSFNILYYSAAMYKNPATFLAFCHNIKYKSWLPQLLIWPLTAISHSYLQIISITLTNHLYTFVTRIKWNRLLLIHNVVYDK